MLDDSIVIVHNALIHELFCEKNCNVRDSTILLYYDGQVCSLSGRVLSFMAMWLPDNRRR
ncbi:hypothetical protein DSUL_170045 [Desulfovibrionales bacterium]